MALDARKARSRRPETSVEELEEVPGQARQGLMDNALRNDPMARLISSEQHQRIVEAIDSLDTEHRAVVLLRDVEGLDYGEIAQVTGIPAGTVKSRLHRARLLLREKLKDLVS